MVASKVMPRRSRMQRHGKGYWMPVLVTMLLLSVIFFSTEGCKHSYNPALYPSYDVLNPGPEVRANPLSFTEDNNLIVNQAFIIWVYELKEEIKKLRQEVDRLAKKLGDQLI